jgi:hypothetical protein
MNCLEFKRLALSDPNHEDVSFTKHSGECVNCLKYVGELRQMDNDLADSLDVAMPAELIARLQLNQELVNEGETRSLINRYAIAASVAVALFVGGFMLSNQVGLNSEVGEDYQQLLAGVVEHMNEQPITPVWDNGQANIAANTLLSSYDDGLKLKQMDNLQFARICPMGQYKGLHATLETKDGQITFAYIKGESLGNLLDATYDGYLTRVKPVRGGNLLIISRTQKSLDQADRELEEAMYWDI